MSTTRSYANLGETTIGPLTFDGDDSQTTLSVVSK